MIEMLKEEGEDAAIEAIKHALKALRKRHLVEEAAHGPAIVALPRPLVYQGLEWKEKAENFEAELQQCYKAQSRAAKTSAQEKESLIEELQKDIVESEQQTFSFVGREECSQVKLLLEERSKALELAVSENQELPTRFEEMAMKLLEVQVENKMLIDRWLLQKMKDAEQLNEANALLGDMRNQQSMSSMQELARLQVDGVRRIPAHDGGCTAILFEFYSSKLVTGGQDQTVKIWDASTGLLIQTLHGCLGSVLDLTITHDNKTGIAASSSNNLYVWDVSTGRISHTLTGHMDKVCAVDVSKVSSRNAVSAAYDRSIKVWDLNRGYCSNTIIFPATVMQSALGWMEGRYVQAMWTGISGCGTCRRGNSSAKWRLTPLA
ncbi:Autophagy-related protein [Drosera capensis]